MKFVWLLLVGIAFGQQHAPPIEQQTSGPHVTPSTKRRSQATLTSAKPTPSSKFLSEAFNVSVTTVGTEFKGHDIVATMEKVRDTPTLKPKSEFESSTEYEQRREGFQAEAMAYGNFAFVLPKDAIIFGSDFKYNADAQTLAVKLIGKREKFYLEKGYPEFDTLIVQSKTISRENYIGRNGFGAQVEVTKIYSEDYGLSFDQPSQVLASGEGSFFRSIAMSPDEARRFKPTARLLIVCTLTEPWYRESVSGHDATFDSPYDTTTKLMFLQVHPKQIWLFNEETGEVMKKWPVSNEKDE